MFEPFENGVKVRNKRKFRFIIIVLCIQSQRHYITNSLYKCETLQIVLTFYYNNNTMELECSAQTHLHLYFCLMWNVKLIGNSKERNVTSDVIKCYLLWPMDFIGFIRVYNTDTLPLIFFYIFYAIDSLRFVSIRFGQVVYSA